MTRGARALLVAVALVAAACGDGADSAPSTTTVTTLATHPGTVPAPLEAFAVRSIEVDGDPWTVAVADTPSLRAQGLMGVTDLGPLDGMLFIFPSNTVGRFWMRDTLIPLEIAFFSADGDLVLVLEMEPCTTEECPTYGPESLRDIYRYALEAPPGILGELPANARLELD